MDISLESPGQSWLIILHKDVAVSKEGSIRVSSRHKTKKLGKIKGIETEEKTESRYSYFKILMFFFLFDFDFSH